MKKTVYIVIIIGVISFLNVLSFGWRYDSVLAPPPKAVDKDSLANIESKVSALTQKANKHYREYAVFMQLLDSAYQLMPDNPQLTYHMGRNYLRAGKYSEGIEYLNRSIDLNPMLSVDVGYTKYRSLRDFRGAEQNFLSYLEYVNPANAYIGGIHIYHYLGICARELGKWEQALDYFAKYEQIVHKPTHLFYIQQALIYYQSKRYQEALVIFRKAHKRQVNIPEVYYYQGLIYRELGDEKEALQNFNQAWKYRKRLRSFRSGEFVSQIYEQQILDQLNMYISRPADSLKSL